MCHCECNCDCVIKPQDVINNPTEYELKYGNNIYGNILAAFDGVKGGLEEYRLHIIFQDPVTSLSRTSTVTNHSFPSQVRRKPKWEPEEGKLYVFSNDPREDKRPSNIGFFERKDASGKYLRVTLSGVLGVFSYCWPIDKDEIGE